MGHLLITAVLLTLLTLFTIAILPSEAPHVDGKGLHAGFYNKSCPRVEDIVAEVVARSHKQDPKLSPGLIRLFFHDCFVKGCDASVLLDKTPSGEPVEKTAPANGDTLRGLELIDEIKAAVEKECPRKVSCADILAFAAREAVFLSGLPRHKVPGGRRDSRTSRAADVNVNLPTPAMPLKDIVDMFIRRGLTVEEMVVLTGSHSIGETQCVQFDDRLYKFSETVQRDPSLDPTYANELAGKCPQNMAAEQAGRALVDLDPVTPLELDVQFYKNLMNKKGLLRSDQALANDPTIEAIVKRMATHPESWTRKYLQAMIKMGRTNVLIKNEGEIRTNCREFIVQPMAI